MKRLSIKLSGAEKSLGEKIISGFQRTLIAGSGVLVLGGGLSGCTQIQGQENTTPTSISTETTTNPDLKDVAPERLEFTKDFLNLYDESIREVITQPEFKTAFNKIEDFISRDQVIKYGETGETGNNFSIVKYKDGSPAVALINCNDKITGCFKTTINEMNKHDPNFLKKITGNGMVAFMVNRFDENQGDNFTFNENGLIVWNITPEHTNMVVGSGGLERPIITESFGIKALNLGGDYTKYFGFIKEQLSSAYWWNLYKKTGNKEYESYSYSSYIFCKTYYNQVYAPTDFRDKEIQDLINNIMDQNLIIPFGDENWDKIKESIVDRPDWNLGDIK